MQPWLNGRPVVSSDWALDIERRLSEIETRQAVAAVHRDNVADRLTAIEDTLRWLMRLIVGGFLMGGVAYVLKGGLLLTGIS